MKKTNWEAVSKNYSDLTMCSNLSNHELKIDCYKHTLVCMKHMVTTNEKSVRNTEELRERYSNVTRQEVINIQEKEQENKKGTEMNYKNNQKTIKGQELHTYQQLF